MVCTINKQNAVKATGPSCALFMFMQDHGEESQQIKRWWQRVAPFFHIQQRANGLFTPVQLFETGAQRRPAEARVANFLLMRYPAMSGLHRCIFHPLAQSKGRRLMNYARANNKMRHSNIFVGRLFNGLPPLMTCLIRSHSPMSMTLFRARTGQAVRLRNLRERGQRYGQGVRAD